MPRPPRLLIDSTAGRTIAVVILFIICAPPAAAAEELGANALEAINTPENVEFFEKRVRPLLVARCQECHAGDKAKGNLRLDARASALEGGDTGPALVPGKPDESLLVDAIRYGETYQMPPKGRLPEDEVAVLVEWVARGAPWPTGGQPSAGKTQAAAPFDFAQRAKHWCFQPLLPATPPAVANTAWPRDDVDRFILAALEAKGLSPAPAADNRVWLRRVTYDLTGLPPTPAEIDDFLADNTPQSRERVVDRLLASPQYGERMARYWLDLVRFAETYGHEHDYEIPNAYQYRDYLIRALNADVPYNRLLVEHLAGDLVEPPRRHPTEHFNESIIGTAFFFFGEARHSPVDVREDEANHIDNQIDVLAKSFLALTVGCARCHDHKFDAITQRDYYALVGYLQSSRYQQAFLNDPAEIAPALADLARLRNEERAALAKYLADAQPQLAQLTSGPAAIASDRVQSRLAAAREIPTDVLHPWAILLGAGSAAGGEAYATQRKALAEQLGAQTSNSDASSTTFADFDDATFGGWFATGAAFGARPSTPADVIASGEASSPLKLVGNSAAHSGLLSDKLAGVLRSPTFTIEQQKIFYRVWGTGGQIRLVVDGLQLIQDPIYGGLKFGPGGTAPHWHTQNVDKWIGHRAYIELIDDGEGWLALDEVRFGTQPPAGERANSLVVALLGEQVAATPSELSAGFGRLFEDTIRWFTDSDQVGRVSSVEQQERAAVINALLALAPLPTVPPADANAGGDAASASLAALSAVFQKTEAERQAIAAKIPAPRRALAIAAGTPENERLFIRGNHRTLGEEVPRHGLQVLGGLEHPAPADRTGRLELAEQLVDGSNPLVPRVAVNRVWQRHFGRGIVPTPDDFGAMGQPPTNPELLDWLAAEFVREGWSLKALDRRIVLSSTYGMSTEGSPAAVAADPENRLLHHMPRRRLEAECIRDGVLAVSGRLDATMYGPGVPPYLSAFMSGRGRPKESGPLDGAGRRSVYLNVRRNFLSPLLLAFDYPTPFTTIGRRSVSNVPAQALAMLNNPFVAEQATYWAKRILTEQAPSADERIARMYVEAFGRPPTSEELVMVRDFLAAQCQEYAVPPEDVRPWSDLAHVLLNAKEFVFVE